MCCLGVLLLCSAGSASELKDEFHLDLRSGKAPPGPVVSIAASAPKGLVKGEPKGLRIAFSGKSAGVPPVGVSPRFRVHGDFEITAAYELIRCEAPKAGYGVGVSIWVMADAANAEAVSISRLNRPWDGNVYVGSRGWWDDSEKKYEQKQNAVPTEAKGGKLRIARTGSKVRFFVAEGSSSDFEEIWQTTFSERDLAQVHVGATTGNSESPVEFRLVDLVLRAEELPLGASAKETSNAWLAWLGAGVAGLAVAGLGYAWRRKAARVEAAPARPK